MLKHALTEHHIRHLLQVNLGNAGVTATVAGDNSRDNSAVPSSEDETVPNKTTMHALTTILSATSTNKIVKAFFEANPGTSPHDVFTYKPLVGGNSNRVFIGVPSKAPLFPIIVREYGSALDLFIHREKELEVATLLSNSSCAPEILGTFDQGRVERFIENTTPATTDTFFEHPTLLNTVMKSLHEFHKTKPQEGGDNQRNTHLDMSKPHTINLILKMVEFVQNHSKPYADVAAAIADGLHGSNDSKNADSGATSPINIAADLTTEAAWLSQVLSEQKDSIVFGHNDLNPGNVLWSGTKDTVDSVTFIDFEYTDYSHKAFDLGNVLCELDYVYDDIFTGGFKKRFAAEHPEFCAKEKYPVGHPILAEALTCTSSEVEKQPLTKLGHLLRNAIRSYYGTPQQELSADDLENTPLTKNQEREVLAGMLASNLLWGAWSIVVACTPPADAEGTASAGADEFQVGASGLDYVEYGHSRLLEYMLLKEWYLKNMS